MRVFGREVDAEMQREQLWVEDVLRGLGQDIRRVLNGVCQRRKRPAKLQ